MNDELEHIVVNCRYVKLLHNCIIGLQSDCNYLRLRCSRITRDSLIQLIILINHLVPSNLLCLLTKMVDVLILWPSLVLEETPPILTDGLISRLILNGATSAAVVS